MYGFATAATSATERALPQAVAEKLAIALCHRGAVNAMLQPLPPPAHTLLAHSLPAPPRDVPPTATTSGELAGKLAAFVSPSQPSLK